MAIFFFHLASPACNWKRWHVTRQHVWKTFFLSLCIFYLISSLKSLPPHPAGQEHLSRCSQTEAAGWNTAHVSCSKMGKRSIFTCLFTQFYCLFVRVLDTHCCEWWWKLHFFLLWEDRSFVAQHMEVALKRSVSLTPPSGKRAWRMYLERERGQMPCLQRSAGRWWKHFLTKEAMFLSFGIRANLMEHSWNLYYFMLL